MMARALLRGGSLWLAVVVILLDPGPWPRADQLVTAQPGAIAAQMPQAPSYQLLTNPSLESYDPPYGQFEGVNDQVASGWQRFWYDGPEPHWMDTRVFASSHLGGGWVERMADETSQMILSTEPYTAGLWQQVGGLTPGVGYGFHAAMLTIFQTSAQEPVHGTMIKEVGLDPSGGTDPRSPQVVWSELSGQDQEWQVSLSTAAYAQATTMTVFMRVTSPHPAGAWPFLNQSFLDSAILARTATVAATSPPVSHAESFEVLWDNAVPSPGDGIRVVRYDVQWLDEAEGIWHEWLTWTEDLAATFTGQRGHRYRFRARAWQRYPNGAHLPSPYQAEGDTETAVGAELTGHVLDSQERAVAGATVTVPETGQTAVSGPDGGFALALAPTSEPRSVVVSHAGWLAPPPVYGLTPTPMATMTVTWTLRPRDDAVTNGDFESGLEGWWATAGSAEGVPEPVHTGHGAAMLTRGMASELGLEPSLTLAAGLSQTVTLVDAWAPALSFWYRAEGTGEDGDLEVVLTVEKQTDGPAGISTEVAGPVAAEISTRVLTPPLQTDSRWHHFWALVDPPRAAFDGTVTADFRLGDQSSGEPLEVFVDEVSVGSTPGGPWGIYLPRVVR